MTQSVGPKRIRAMQRHRRSVAGLILESLPDDDTNHALDSWGFGQTFDVHAAREHGLRLVAMADEQMVFEDWTRGLGLGPENRERGVFVAPGCLYCPAPGSINGAAECRRACDCGYGGWPGKVAREYADERAPCKTCSHGTATELYDRSAHAMGGAYSCSVRRIPCPACSVRRKRFTRAPMGRSLARLGQRLLDMLDGRCSWAPSAPAQSSECQACRPFVGVMITAVDGVNIFLRAGQRIGTVAAPGLQVVGQNGQPRAAEVGETVAVPCNECHGTGHNLAGVVPPIEWSPAVRRRLADMPIPGPVPPAFEADDWIDLLIRDGGQALLDARDTPLRTVMRCAPTRDPARSLVYLVHVERAIANDRRPFNHVIPVARSLTRVVPRGEHILMGHDPETAPDLCRGWAPQITNSASLPGSDLPTDDQCEDAMPAWRRGEIRHGEQRIEKQQ